ncbi:unnamed protein product [Lepidochelys olivacea]
MKHECCFIISVTEVLLVWNIWCVSLSLSLSGPKPVVFLHHGLLADGTSWIINLATNSLGFILADAGYDVWIGNSRGNTWSRRHINLSVHQEEFWAFSYDEMAKYDHPAVIDFIVQKTGQEKLYYVGHSEGTTTAFIAFSTMPQLAQIIQMYFAFAPIATLKYAQSLLTKLALLPDAVIKSWSCYQSFVATSCLSYVDYREELKYELNICVYNTCPSWNLCTKRDSRETAAIKSSKLKAYDCEIPSNKVHYDQDIPPLYNVTDMQVPTAMWSGGNDWLADPTDVAFLFPQVTNLVYHKVIPDWNHLDFIWGLDAPERVYNEILDLMRKNT